MIELTAATIDGKRIDYTPALRDADLSTQRFDSPASLKFTGLELSGIAIPEGSTVKLTEDGETVFSGFVFRASRNKIGEVTYTAYDQLRYLKANASFTFTNADAAEVIRTIAEYFGLTVGDLADTGYKFPVLVFEDQSCLDMIFDTVSQTIYQTGTIYVFYDDNGKLVLREASRLVRDSIIGDGSLMTDYEYARDIDRDTYNRIKLARANEETGRTDVYIVEDTDSIRKWGMLQYYESVDKNLNAAQIEELCGRYLKYYNRVLQSLTLDALGVPGLRAGNIIPVFIRDVEVLSLNRVLLIEKITHHYEGSGYHDMTLDVRSFEQLGGGDG